MDKILNLCPHDVNVYVDGKLRFHFPPANAKNPLRLNQEEAKLSVDDDDLPVTSPPIYTGLNFKPEPGSRVIVSQIVAVHLEAHQNEYKLKNVYSPDSSPEGGVRDDKGQISGTKRLIKYF